MIIYNVTIKVDKEIVPEWLKWMKEEHMPQLMDTGLFLENKLCRLLDHDDAEGATYVAQYYCDTLDHYHRYLSEHADIIREKSFSRFGNKFIAFRTIMEVEQG